jgi:hypothetical protein
LEAPESLTEAVTGRTFQSCREGEGSLLALDARCMMGWCSLPIARAYAFALYGDALLLDFCVGLHKSHPLSVPVLLDTLEFMHAGGGSPAPGVLSVVIKLHRDIDGPHLAHGFENSVRKKLLAIVGTRVERVADVEGAMDQLRALSSAFIGKMFQSGEELVFSWDPARGRLTLRAQDRDFPALSHPTLCRALFEVYVGKEAVSKKGAAAFSSNLASLASGSVSRGPTLARLVEKTHLS